jgi:subtilisin family serine protease
VRNNARHRSKFAKRHAVLIAALALAGISAAKVHAQSAALTAEELKSPGVYQIKASTLYGAGVTGAGVTAAIIDTGILTTHPEFAGRVLTGYNAFDGSTNVTDRDGHGTHVAGIIAAGRNNPSTSGMFGAAYGAYLLPIKVLDDNGYGTSESVAAGILYAVSQRTSAAVLPQYKPFAINLSLGSTDPLTVTPTLLLSPTNLFTAPSVPSTEVGNALLAAVRAGMVVVAAAGNEGAAVPIYPAGFAKEGWANGQIIAVGAVDATGKLASWSNRAGDSAQYYLVAPGVSIYSTYEVSSRRSSTPQATYATLSGTSMATPYVTAGVTLIKSGWTFLTARQVVDILLTTADDLGAPGVDPVYGRGLINLGAALSPIGALTVPTAGGATTSLAGTSLVTTAATGAALRAAARGGQFQVAAFDQYGRDFQVDLAPSLRQVRSTATGFAPMLTAIEAGGETKKDRNGMTFRVTQWSDATRAALGSVSQEGNNGYSFSAIDASGYELSMGFSGMGGQAFGLSGELARRDEGALMPFLANPYFSLAAQHSHAAIGVPLTSSLRLKVGTVVSDNWAMPSDFMPQQRARQHQNITLAELTGTVGRSLWSVGVGRLQENGSVLGSTVTGALGWTGTVGTTVFNLGTAVALTPDITVGAQYSTGYSSGARNNADSLVSGYSDMRSASYAVFTSLRGVLDAKDRLTLTLSQPLRATAGSMDLLVPVRAAEDGSPVMERRSILLRPTGRETRADLLYLMPVDRTTKAFVGATFRTEPDHDASAPPQKFLGVGMKRVF